MTGKQVIESMDNAWRALCVQYDNARDEETRRALNLLSRVTQKMRSEFNEAEKNDGKQITIEEWLAWLNSDEE